MLRCLLALGCLLLLSLALACDDGPGSAPDSSSGARPPHLRPAGFDGGVGVGRAGAGGNGSAGAAQAIWEDNSSSPPVPDATAPTPDAGDDASTDDASLGDPCSGSIVLLTVADVTAAAQCTAIGGALTITGEQLETVRLPLLESIADGLKVEGAALRELDLPALHTIGIEGEADGSGGHLGSLVIVDVPALTAVQLPALDRITDSIQITGDPALVRVELPALRTVTGDVWIADDDALAAVIMPALEDSSGRTFWIRGKQLAELVLTSLRNAGAIDIASAGALDAIELPALEIAEVVGIGPTSAAQLVLPKLRWTDRGLSIRENPSLTSLELPVFEEIASGWTGANHDPTVGIEIEDNAHLASVQLPVLRQLDGFLVVADNPSLQQLELPLLTRIAGDLRVTGNASLVACDVQMLASQLSVEPEHSDLTGNAGTCP